jgi:hypothetical protein
MADDDRKKTTLTSFGPVKEVPERSLSFGFSLGRLFRWNSSEPKDRQQAGDDESVSGEQTPTSAEPLSPTSEPETPGFTHTRSALPSVDGVEDSGELVGVMCV